MPVVTAMLIGQVTVFQQPQKSTYLSMQLDCGLMVSEMNKNELLVS